MLKLDTLFVGSFCYIDAYSFMSIFYVFLILLALLFILVVSFTIYKKRIEYNKQLWHQTIAGLISEAIFSDDEELCVEITENIQTLLRKTGFRNCLLNELVKVKINLSGVSGQNLKKLYELLNLDKDSYRKLNSSKGHIKAKGLQELAIMEQVKYVKKIFKLTNSTNELVRNEAQCALVSFHGFLGLRFLNVTTYPISQWQQIQLLNKLNKMTAANFEPIKKWLQSSNESVIIFSLKLAAYYNCNNMHTDIINCMQSASQEVKLCALKYFKKMPDEACVEQIISHYFSADKMYKLALLDALITIGTQKQIPFILSQLQNNDDEIKSAAATCISQLHPSGAAFLQTHYFADVNPWKAIFLQIKNNRAA